MDTKKETHTLVFSYEMDEDDCVYIVANPEFEGILSRLSYDYGAYFDPCFCQSYGSPDYYCSDGGYSAKYCLGCKTIVAHNHVKVHGTLNGVVCNYQDCMKRLERQLEAQFKIQERKERREEYSLELRIEQEGRRKDIRRERDARFEFRRSADAEAIWLDTLSALHLLY